MSQFIAIVSRGSIRPLLVLLMILGVLFVPPGCEKQPSAGESGVSQPSMVIVSIPPLAGLIGPLLAEGTEIRVLVPPGRSVHGFKPTPEDVATAGRADAIVFVGLGLESGMARTVRRKSVITMALLVGIEHDPDAHADHDHAHAHGEGANDPHIWLDPVLVARFVRALPGSLPEKIRHDSIEARAEAIAKEIDEIGIAYHDRLAPFSGQAIVTHHTSFNRLAERYGLRVAAVLRGVETLEPSPADLASAARAIRDEGVRTIFTEPQFGSTSASRVAEISGARLITLDPLGDGDWFEMMRTNLDALVDGLRP